MEASKQRVVFVGGGLANALAAYRLSLARPDLELVVIERDAEMLGEHTWSFHGGDLLRAGAAGVASSWIAPFVTASWPRYAVRFPGQAREVGLGYHAIRSGAMVPRFRRLFPGAIMTGTSVTQVEASGVTLADGTRLAADWVVDGRGAAVDATRGVVGYQAFYGRFLKLARPHGLRGPTLMDATGEQAGGFRFMYVLPFAPDMVLVEDTLYGREAHIDVDASGRRIDAYARQLGLEVCGDDGDERAALPIPLTGVALTPAPVGVVRSGVAAGLFHAVTGYSVGEAVQFAEALAAAFTATASPSRATLARDLQRRAQGRWRRAALHRRLNNMFFLAAPAEARYKVLMHFYQLEDAVIGRFYAGEMSWRDWARFFSGPPPVAPLRGVRSFLRVPRSAEELL